MKQMVEALKSLSENLCISRNDSVIHKTASKLLQDQYRHHFKCDLQHFMPNTISKIVDGDVVATTGYRAASDDRLFLESYLQTPVEECLSAAFNRPIHRREIVEIGSFAVTTSSYVLPFMFQLAPVIQEMGFSVVVCTVTRSVRRYLAKLGVEAEFLGDATPDQVNTEHNAWGNYYDQNPCVLAGEVSLNIGKMLPFQKFLNR